MFSVGKRSRKCTVTDVLRVVAPFLCLVDVVRLHASRKSIIKDVPIKVTESIKSKHLKQLVKRSGILVKEIKSSSEEYIDCTRISSLLRFTCSASTGHLAQFRFCSNLQQISLGNSRYLKILDCRGCRELKSVDCEANLEVINFYFCSRLRSLGSLASRSVSKIDLSGCNELGDLSALANCNLTSLKLSWNERLLDLSMLRPSLISLDISGCENLRSLKGIEVCTSLVNLDISGSNCIWDLRPISKCHQLERLNLGCLPRLREVPVLSILQRLRCVDLQSCRQVSVKGIVLCKILERLILRACGVFSVRTLASCKMLQFLDISQSEVKDIESLLQCPKLKVVVVSEKAPGLSCLRSKVGLDVRETRRALN